MNKLEEYIERYKAIYSSKNVTVLVKGSLRAGENYGDGIEFVKKVYPFLNYTIWQKKRAISILDYGCGTANHTHNPNYFNNDVHPNETIFSYTKGMIQCYYCYDPAFLRYRTKPSPGTLFDMVAIADVLEHVPEEHVDEVVLDAASFVKADGVLVITVSNNPSFSHFKNSDGSIGENLHCTLKPFEWWIEKILGIVKDRAFVIAHNDIEFMKSIGSKATVRYFKNDSPEFYIDKDKFPYAWVDK